MAILQMDIQASMDKLRIVDPANSIVAPVPPAVPIIPETCKTMSLDVTPCASWPSTCINNILGLLLIQSACSQHVLHLRRADPEGERAKGTVCRCVRITTYSSGSRKGEALLGAKDVDNPLSLVGDAEIRQVEVLHVAFNCQNLVAALLIRNKCLNRLEALT